MPMAIVAKIMPMTRVTTPIPDSPNHFDMGPAKLKRKPIKAESAKTIAVISNLPAKAELW
jgi:hypothetical protein